MYKYFLVVVLAILINGCEIIDHNNLAKLSKAAKCHATELQDGGYSIIGEYSTYPIKCVLDAVSFPDWARAEISSTRAIDGRRSAEWDGLIATWSYDGDDVHMVIRIQ